MIKLILNPYEGVGNIKIGMTKDDISNVLNITPKTFMKSEDEFVDDFKMMHVYYNIEVDEYGFTSYKYGFNIYGDSEEVESLFVFENGYYNK